MARSRLILNTLRFGIFGFFLALTLGYGPVLFPGYVPDVKHYFSRGGAKHAEVGSRTRGFHQVNPVEPELTWRQKMHEFLMLGPVNLSTPDSTNKSELQKLRSRTSRSGGSHLSTLSIN